MTYLQLLAANLYVINNAIDLGSWLFRSSAKRVTWGTSNPSHFMLRATGRAFRFSPLPVPGSHISQCRLPLVAVLLRAHNGRDCGLPLQSLCRDNGNYQVGSHIVSTL